MKVPIALIGVIMVLSSCNQQEAKNFDALVFVKFSSDNTTSFKICSSDTLDREIKHPLTTQYSYKILNKTEKEQLKELVDKLQNLTPTEHSFAVGLNQSMLYIKRDTSNAYYTNLISANSVSYRKLSGWFERYIKDTTFEATKAIFWNVEGVHEPPGPPNPVDSTKTMLPLTSSPM